MNKKNFSFIALCAFLSSSLSALTDRLPERTLPAKAVCVVPVANMFNEYLNEKKEFKGSLTRDLTDAEIRRGYYAVLASNENNTEFMRIHQLLFNQIVTVLEIKGIECKVQCEDHFSQNKEGQKPYNTYVMLTEHLVFLDDLPDNALTRYLPTPFIYHDEQSYALTSDVFTLTRPFRDWATGIHFSVGTRFKVVNGHKRLMPGIVEIVDVYRLTPQSSFEIMTIETKYGTFNTPTTPAQAKECIKDFLAAYATTMESHKAAATLAFGGSSITRTFNPLDYKKTSFTRPDGYKVKGFNRNQQDAAEIQTGCSMPELRSMAERVCNVPSFIKNTTTLLRLGRRLADNEQLEECDYICAQGYLGTVFSLEENFVVDIKNYMHCDGYAHLESLSKTFQGIFINDGLVITYPIHTYDDLVNAYRSKHSLAILDRTGENIIVTFKGGEWALIKFSPAYRTYMVPASS